MLNLFVLGSVQKPVKSVVESYLPDIGFFAAKSHFINALTEAQAGGADSNKFKRIVINYNEKNEKGKDVIYQTETQLLGEYPLLEQMLDAYQSGDNHALMTSFDALKSKGRAELCNGMPALFASMAAGYMLNQRHALVDGVIARIKMAAASLTLIDQPDCQSSPEERVAFIRDYMAKAIPRLGIKPPYEPESAFPLGPAPVDRDEPVVVPVDHMAKFAELAAVQSAIKEVEETIEMRAIDDRHAPPSLGDFERMRRLPEADTAVNLDKTTRRASSAQPDAQITKADHARAMAEYQSRALGKDDLARLSPAGREALTAAVGAGSDVQAEVAVAKLRRRAAAINTDILNLPHAFEAYTDHIMLGAYLVEVRKNVFDDITCVPQPKQCHCRMLQDMDERHAGLPQLYVLGTGTSYRIDTTFSQYQKGELVHTEPVVRGSKRATTFRLLNRTEEEVETTISNEEEQEQEASSDERFKLEKEMESETRSESAMNMGASVTASYGPVSLSANFGMSSSTATQAKEKQAMETAQQKTSRALSRIRKKTETRTLTKRLAENERTSGFTLDNTDNPSFTAYFHAIDAEYTNQLVSIGTRMVIRVCMQEFMAPLLHYLMTEPESPKVLKQPIAPDKIPNPLIEKSPLLKSFADIKSANYVHWLALFGISNAPPPPENITVAEHAHGSPGADWNPGSGVIKIPEGYVAYQGNCSTLWSGGAYIDVLLGGWYIPANGGCELNLTDSVPWGYRGNAGSGFTLNITISCKPSDAKIAAWQMKIFDLIWTKYRRELSDYENSLQMAKIEAGITMSGRNPRKNEILVREELMKMVLGATFPQFYYRGLNSMKFGYKCIGRDENGEPVTGGPPIPEPDFMDAKEEAPWVTFMSKLYEFENMTFDLKPYFFGNRAKWCTLRTLVDPDPRMEAAMSAGYVTIDVPVSLGMETAFMHYMATGQIWNGADMPIIGDPLYEALAIEIMNGQNPDGLPVGKPWTTVLPTSLVMVSDDAPAAL
jgi:hypothetical protein